MAGKGNVKLHFFVPVLLAIIIMQPALGIDISYSSHDPLQIHSSFLPEKTTILSNSEITLNGTDYFIAHLNYSIGILSGDEIFVSSVNKLRTNSTNSYIIENNRSLQNRVIEHYSYVKESGYLKKVNLTEISNLSSSIENFTNIASPIACYSGQILGYVNEICTTRVNYDSVNLTLISILEELDPELATGIIGLKSTTQTIYDLSEPLVYNGNCIISILSQLKPELSSLANGSAIPNVSINDNLIKLSVEAKRYVNDTSAIYGIINSYDAQIQSFLTIPATGINVQVLSTIISSMDSTSASLTQEIQVSLAYPVSSTSRMSSTLSKESNDAVEEQNMTFTNVYNSVKFEEAVPYLIVYIQFFIVSAVMILLSLIFSRKTRKNNKKEGDSRKSIVSNLLALGVINLGGTISTLALLYLFGFMNSFNMLHSFFPMVGLSDQSTSNVLSPTTSLGSMPVSWLMFMAFSILCAIVFIWFAFLSHRHLSRSLKIYADEGLPPKRKERAPTTTFIPGFLVLMGEFLIIVFIQNPQVFPGSITIFIALILLGYFIFAIIFPFSIISLGRRIKLLGKFTENRIVKIAGNLYIAGIGLIYCFILYVASYFFYAYSQKFFPPLTAYEQNIPSGFFYVGIILLSLASIVLISGSFGGSHPHKANN